MIFTSARLKPTQQRFWPDAQPLVDRLGRDFFRSLPERPGVYLMRSATEVVLYVGKAKNLRKRLRSYRVANPERMARRHLRLLRLVVRIELQECDDEQAALRREAELLRTLKPRFNRAGTWRGTPRFLAWRTKGDSIEFIVTTTPEAGWSVCGPMGGGAAALAALLARLLWLGINPNEGVERLPVGWVGGYAATPIHVPTQGGDASARLDALLSDGVENFCQWIAECRSSSSSPFELAWLNAEFESLREWFRPPLEPASRPAP